MREFLEMRYNVLSGLSDTISINCLHYDQNLGDIVCRRPTLNLILGWDMLTSLALW
jgi:hypothetical protein